MSKLTLQILNRTISINCKDGDETKITAVSERLHTRLKTLQQQLSANDIDTLIIGCVILLDELETASAKYDSLKSHTDTQNNESKGKHTQDADIPIHIAEKLESAIIDLESLSS